MTNVNANMMKNRFRTDLVNEGCELRKILLQNDVLKSSVLQNCLNTFNDHLKLVASQYALEMGECNSKTVSAAMRTLFALGGISKNISAGVAGWMETIWLMIIMFVSSVIGITGVWMFENSLVDPIAVVVVTAGISLLFVIGGITVLKRIYAHEREVIIRNVMDQYERKTVPQLLGWFDKDLVLLETDN